jgi:predicted nucleic acid-binding protein
MPNPSEVLVFDTGPLSHIAKRSWLGPLRFMVRDCCAVIPDTVVAELRAGLPGRPYLDMVLSASWLTQHVLCSPDELDAFATFSSFLVANGRNQGEAGVLAYAKVHGATAIIDDRPARNAAQRHGITCRGTLGLICDAVNQDQMGIDMAAALADDLLESEYRLPFKPGEFIPWARNNGLISK